MKSDMAVQTQIHKVLERFNELVSTKNMQILAEFAPGDDTLLIGSDSGEIAKGSQEIEAFFTRIFARDETFSWEWNRIDVSQLGNLAWIFADGWVILSTSSKQLRSPYRITGVLERRDGRWLWRQYHGSEPVVSE